MHSCLLNKICFKSNICREHCGLTSILVHVCISGVSSKPLSTQVDFLVIQELFMRIYLTSFFSVNELLDASFNLASFNIN